MQPTGARASTGSRRRPSLRAGSERPRAARRGDPIVRVTRVRRNASQPKVDKSVLMPSSALLQSVTSDTIVPRVYVPRVDRRSLRLPPAGDSEPTRRCSSSGDTSTGVTVERACKVFASGVCRRVARRGRRAGPSPASAGVAAAGAGVGSDAGGAAVIDIAVLVAAEGAGVAMPRRLRGARMAGCGEGASTASPIAAFASTAAARA